MTNYLKDDANSYHLNSIRAQNQGMPTFPKYNPLKFPRVGKPLGKKERAGVIAADSTRGRFAAWTQRVLQLDRATAAHAVAQLLKNLADLEALNTTDTSSKGTMYSLPEDTVIVSQEEDPRVLECTSCRTKTGMAAGARKQLINAPCFVSTCTGHLVEVPVADNYYRQMYSASEPRTVVAAEHTGLVPDKERQAIEKEFRADETTTPDAPNVLVATPTLEMGIDIGSLGTVILSSMPDTVSSYVQRVGRAGRRSGNSLILALVRGRGKALPKLNNPLSMIAGSVQPPAAFLRATEILQRQLLARIMDHLELGAVRDIRDVFHGDTATIKRVYDLIDNHPGTLNELVEGFMTSLGRFTDEETKDRLRTWAEEGLASQIDTVVTRWEETRQQLLRRIDTLNSTFDELQRQKDDGHADEQSLDEYKEVSSALKINQAELTNHLREWWISALERYGLLPNFTLLDDVVYLNVGLQRQNLDSGEYELEAREYDRGLSSALQELAPGNNFYVQGTRALIDAVDLGAGRNTEDGDVQIWRVCPSCSYIQTDANAVGTGACPECGDAGFGDINQAIRVLPMRKVSSEVTQSRAGIGDMTDDRITHWYSMAEGCTIPDTGRGEAWFTEQLGFGAAMLNEVELRWLNLGSGKPAAGGTGSTGEPVMIGGAEKKKPLFTVCSYCGHVPAQKDWDQRYGHRAWCKHRRSAEQPTAQFALGRTLVTQGVLLYLPRTISSSDSLAVPSLTAAIMLGFKQVLGGDPQHLGVTTVTVASGENNQPAPALLIHDNVPGGTGYLSQFASAHDVRDLLLHAYDVVHNCHCKHEGRQSCPDCLLPYTPPAQMENVVRSSAEYSLAQILGDTVHVPDDRPSAETLRSESWSITAVQPELDPQSELELRFNQLIRAELDARNIKTWETTRNGRTILNFRAPGSMAGWRMEQEKSERFTRPDFTFTSDDANVRGIAVYLDGAAFHVSAQNFRVDDDIHKRVGLVSEGLHAWSMTWEDLERYETQSGTPEFQCFDVGREPVDGPQRNFNREQRAFLSNDPLRQLVDLLVVPDPEVWEGLADMAVLAMVQANGGSANARRDGLEVTIADQLRVEYQLRAGRASPHVVELVTGGAGAGVGGGAGGNVCGVDGRDVGAGAGVGAGADVEPMDVGVRRDVWNAFLSLSNLAFCWWWALRRDDERTTGARS